MQILFSRSLTALLLLFICTGLNAQLITSSPAAPTDDQAVVITFDATQGTAGLADCNCDVYLHTGVITSNSESDSDWQYVQTVWGEANEDWKLAPVEGEPNKYTYTYGPTVRAYFGVPAEESIEKIAFVFRNADGSLEGKATGGNDIFVDVSAGGGALSLNLAGDPGSTNWPLGKPLPVSIGTTSAATIELFDNDSIVASATGTELNTDVVLITSGDHVIKAVATTPDGQTAEREFTVAGEFVVEILSPDTDMVFAEVGDRIDLVITSYLPSAISISGLAPITTDRLERSFNVARGSAVTDIVVTATYEGQMDTDQFVIVVGDPVTAEPPMDTRPGATDMDNGDVLLLLRAPGKQDVFVLQNGDYFAPRAANRMKRSADGETFWLIIPDIALEDNLIYQYLIDGNLRQPDPYSTLILDPNSDRFIDAETFPGIPAYPENTEGILSWHRRSVAPYVWQTTDYDRPDPEKMVIYELLLRDFLADHSFKSLTDTLDYLERLGVNAIELMPVSEFENNDSWGYNVSFHMALDKYYGTPEDFKALVDECHARGMAVILDVVYNHAFGQSPLARMWWDEANFRPTPDNPYLNVEARHPFNVGYDFNHESALTKEYLKVSTRYWLEEFRVDGFRFDLSKGFTQTDSGDDVGAWNRYDAGRIATIKEYADHVWSVTDGAYMIMEHLAENREEKELAEYGQGMYFWAGFNPHDEFLEASMGYESNLREVIAENRGFDGPNLVAYMESHDEERMQYKNEQFGNSADDYNIRDEATGLDRIKLASAFFYTVPGPKMLWQFGELGYDFNINYCADGTTNSNCRVDAKPIRWNYRFDDERAAVYNVIADLLYLRNNFDFLHGDVLRQDLAGTSKLLHLSGEDGTAVVMGNFGVEEASIEDAFPDGGEWHDYFSGEVRTIIDPNNTTFLAPGEFRIFLSSPVERLGGQLPVSLNDREVARLGLTVSPNPSSGNFYVQFELAAASATTIDLLDATGRSLRQLYRGRLGSGMQNLALSAVNVPAGLYFLRINDGVGTGVRAIVLR